LRWSPASFIRGPPSVTDTPRYWTQPGAPDEYAEALYPNRPKKQFYLFTAIGIALAVIGFVTLHVLFKGDEASSAVSLVKFIPLICMPIGIAIDVKRFSKV
ncbi:hypothetical protein, partial [Corynebacterium sp. KPL2680]|uniref:hypothetical protein n=1 Tax=Corynebacterium sp. KPL2680 TaxID=3158310 RepID=UPI0032ED7CF4